MGKATEFFMMRIGLPNGLLTSHQLRVIGDLTKKYARNLADITTRQNIQFNWIKLAELPDALADLAEVGIHAMQTSGNCTRNITADQWAALEADAFSGAPIDQADGFVHLSTAAQLAETLDLHFSGQSGLVIAGPQGYNLHT